MLAKDLAQWALPQFDGARCVHAAIEQASCQACVDVCPKMAWHLDDTALELDEALCDGCGLCVPACPRQAITLPLSFVRHSVAGNDALFSACRKVGMSQAHAMGKGHIACLHAISLPDLLRAYQSGERVWLLAHGDCTECLDGQGESLFSRAEQLNIALRQRGRPPILLRKISMQAWSTLVDEHEPQEGQARRGFFKALSLRPMGALLGNTSPTNPSETRPPGEYMPEGDDAMLPWVVNIAATQCVGCHACARVCPEDAIHFEDETPAYRLRHRACTGCGLCIDICEVRAIEIRPWDEPAQTTLPLVEKRCERCGVSFHTPIERDDSTVRCWVCARTKPAQRLFQVMN